MENNLPARINARWGRSQAICYCRKDFPLEEEVLSPKAAIEYANGRRLSQLHSRIINMKIRLPIGNDWIQMRNAIWQEAVQPTVVPLAYKMHGRVGDSPLLGDRINLWIMKVGAGHKLQDWERLLSRIVRSIF